MLPPSGPPQPPAQNYGIYFNHNGTHEKVPFPTDSGTQRAVLAHVASSSEAFVVQQKNKKAHDTSKCPRCDKTFLMPASMHAHLIAHENGEA